MFGSAFGGAEDMEPAPEEAPIESVEEETEEADISDDLPEEEKTTESTVEEDPEEDPVEESTEEPEEEGKTTPSKGPPSGPPSKGPPSKGPPSGPPSKGPPSGPPSKGPPSGPPSKGPPSKGPPSGPPSKGPPQIEEPEEEVVEELEEEAAEDPVEAAEESEEDTTEATEEAAEEPAEESEAEEPATEDSSETTPTIAVPNTTRTEAAEAEVLQLSNQVNSLRKSLAGAAEVIEDLETPPMPPAVFADIVVQDHLVADIARLARQLDREQLVRANMGTIAMLHPGMPGVMLSTKKGTLLPRLDERGITGGRLGQNPPEEATSDWRILEVLLASKSLDTGGPAACIHMHGAFTTAASCEKDLILCTPIDEVGKKELGKIIIVDPDEENPDDFLRQTADALKQGGMKCVVIRGHGAYSLGADLDDAWANAAMLEHSMQIVLLARQAKLKI
jgi:ribulose-5-phosphate 4-epimerase/fuculose-1-phosphate aldolase